MRTAVLHRVRLQALRLLGGSVISDLEQAGDGMVVQTWLFRGGCSEVVVQKGGE